MGQGAFKTGITALRRADRSKVGVLRQPIGSADVDAALRTRHPNAARWDYVVGMGSAGASVELVWIEVHPASSSANVGEVEGKLTWLLGWLSGPLSTYRRRIVWISSGSTSFTSRSPQIRRLALQGCLLAGSYYRLA